MRARAHALVRTLIPLAVSLGFVGCSLAYCDDAFQRERALRTGEIAGTALLPGVETKPAAFVQAAVRGTSLVRRTASDGRFLFSGLEEGPWMITVSEDQNGDGVPERRRVVSAVLRYVPHRTSPSFVPLVGGEGVPQLSGVDVGEVLLEGTVRVSGRVLIDGPDGFVPPSALGRVAVIVAGRELALPRLDSDGTDPVSLGAESKTGADATGAFLLRNVSAGRFYLMVLIYDEGTSLAAPGALLQVSAPVELRAQDGETLTLDRDIVLPDDVSGPALAPIQLVFSPPPSSAEQAYLMFVPPGLEMPPCEDEPLDYADTPFPYTLTSSQVGAGPLVIVNDAPVGVWDIQACFTSSPPGRLFAQTVTQQSDTVGGVLLGPVLLTDQQACRTQRVCDFDEDCTPGFQCDASAGVCVPPEGWSDCDGDEARGLPAIVGEDERAIWASCVAQCFSGPGVPAGDLTCVGSDGNVYDCDDDGDGQPDVTEEQACYGVGRGTDADGDGLCDGIDPWPECRANTALECEAGREPDAPTVPASYGGGGGSIDPQMCPYQPRFAEVGLAFCQAFAEQPSEQCSIGSMSCDFVVAGGSAPLERCQRASGLGCSAGLICVLSHSSPEDDVAPCAYLEDQGCTVDGDRQPCPTGYVCHQVDEAGGLRCTADVEDPAFDAVAGTATCNCCADPSSCPSGGQDKIITDDSPVWLPEVQCLDRERASLWNLCIGATSGGVGQGPPDAGPEAVDAGAPGFDAGSQPADGGSAGGTGGFSCDPAAPTTRTYSGPTDFDDPTWLDGIDCLRAAGGPSGQIDLNNTTLTRIDLKAVRYLDASLFVHNSSQLTSIEGAALEHMTGALTLDNNPLLDTLSLPQLAQIDGDLKILRNPSLIVPSAFASVPAQTSLIRANGCGADPDCSSFGGTCQFATGLNANVCAECTESVPCGGADQCDTTYTSTGTGIYTCSAGAATDAGLP